MEKTPVLLIDTVSGDMELMFCSSRATMLSGVCDGRRFTSMVDHGARLNIVLVGPHESESVALYDEIEIRDVLQRKFRHDIMLRHVYRETQHIMRTDKSIRATSRLRY